MDKNSRSIFEEGLEKSFAVETEKFEYKRKCDDYCSSTLGLEQIRLEEIKLKDLVQRNECEMKALSKSERDKHYAIFLFNLFDFDSSRSMGSEEIGKFLQFLGYPSNSEFVTAMLKEVDTDNSGDIQLDEFLSWYCKDKRSKHNWAFYLKEKGLAVGKLFEGGQTHKLAIALVAAKYKKYLKSDSNEIGINLELEHIVKSKIENAKESSIPNSNRGIQQNRSKYTVDSSKISPLDTADIEVIIKKVG